jgi:hypothetical protein
VKGDPVPDPDHILRYAGGAHIDVDSETGNPVILGSAFISRPRDHGAISVHWLEAFSGSLEEQVSAARAVSRLSRRRSARFARLNVGQLRSYVAENNPAGTSLEVTQDPLEPDPTHGLEGDRSHSLVSPVPYHDDPIAELVGDLIAHCVLDIFPAVTAQENTRTDR